MSKTEAPIEAIKKFIPDAAATSILDYLNKFQVHLTITRERKTILGDYRHATDFKNHRISVNGNLNKYSFLITLVHELAHLVTFLQHSHKVEPHGKEWKKIYASLLEGFLNPAIFPADLLQSLHLSLHNLPASSCSDEKLMRVLKKYDKTDGSIMVEQLDEGSVFDAGGGRLFRKGKKLRKRYQCAELATGKLYLFSPIYEVRQPVQP